MSCQILTVVAGRVTLTLTTVVSNDGQILTAVAGRVGQTLTADVKSDLDRSCE